MSTQETPDDLVTKVEALGMVTRFIERPGVMDLPIFMELLKWQAKLTLWVHLERENKYGNPDRNRTH